MKLLRPRWIAGIILALLLSFGIASAQVLPIFRIGVLDAVDGPLTRGAQLAVEEINQAGGVIGADGTAFELQLVIQPVDDLAAAVNNINQASVIAVIGPVRSETVLGNREVLASLGVPILTAGTDDTLLVNDTSNQLFRIRARESLQGQALAQYLIQDLSAASIATVQLDLESTVGVIGFQRAASQLGLPPSPELLFSEETTMSSIVTTILSQMSQFVVVYGPPEMTADLYTELRSRDWPGRFVYNQAGSRAFREAVQEELLDGVIGATTWAATYNDARSEAFVLNYIRLFGAVPSALDAAAYDAVRMLEAAIALPGNLRANLLGLRDVVGVQGVLSPAELMPGELSDNLTVTQLGSFGAPASVVRFAGSERIPEEEDLVVQVSPTPTITNTPPASPTPMGAILTITRAVQNVRTGPGLNFDILGQLQEGQQAQIIGANIDFSWVAINFRGTVGWLSRPILDISGDTNAVPFFTPPPPPPTAIPTATPSAQPFPDLIVTQALPNRLTIGSPFNVTVTIRNQGSVDAGPFAVAATFEPGSVFTSINLNGLAANTQTSFSLSGTLSGGTGLQDVAIVADLNSQVAEGQAGEQNNVFSFMYIADAPLLTLATPTGTLTVADLGTVTLDGGSQDIQWGGGGIVPLGATRLVRLQNFTDFNQVHRDAIANAALQNLAVVNAQPGELIGIETDGGTKYGVLQIISAVAGGNVTFTYRMYDS